MIPAKAERDALRVTMFSDPTWRPGRAKVYELLNGIDELEAKLGCETCDGEGRVRFGDNEESEPCDDCDGTGQGFAVQMEAERDALQAKLDAAEAVIAEQKAGHEGRKSMLHSLVTERDALKAEVERWHRITNEEEAARHAAEDERDRAGTEAEALRVEFNGSLTKWTRDRDALRARVAELQATLGETADALEVQLGADPDMQSFEADQLHAEAVLERAAAVLVPKETP